MKGPIIGAIVAAAACAVAQYPSFDVVFVLDRGDKTIKRFDGRTGTYFGSIGDGNLNGPTTLSLGGTSNRLLYVGDYWASNDLSTIKRFDSFTGEFLGSWLINGKLVGISADPGALFVATESGGSTVLQRLDPNNGGSLKSWTTAGIGFTDLEFQDDHGAGDLVSIANPTSGQILSWLYNLGTNAEGGAFSTLATGARGVGQRGAFLAAANGANGISGITAWPSPFMNFAEDIADGHVNLYASGRIGSQGVVARLDPNLLGITDSFGQGVLIDPGHIVVAQAPEPGTLAAVALGLVALIRRRKNS